MFEYILGGFFEYLDDFLLIVNGLFKIFLCGGVFGGGWYEGDGFNIVEDYVFLEKLVVKLGFLKWYFKLVGCVVL